MQSQLLVNGPERIHEVQYFARVVGFVLAVQNFLENSLTHLVWNIDPLGVEFEVGLNGLSELGPHF